MTRSTWFGRDQITRLVDLNGDGETDFYQNFNNDTYNTEHFHEPCMDLQTDATGNFYYMKAARHALRATHPHHGTLIRVSPSGRTSEVVCPTDSAPRTVLASNRGQFSMVLIRRDTGCLPID